MESKMSSANMKKLNKNSMHFTPSEKLKQKNMPGQIKKSFKEDDDSLQCKS